MGAAKALAIASFACTLAGAGARRPSGAAQAGSTFVRLEKAWSYVGPFAIGKAEGFDADPLGAYGGVAAAYDRIAEKEAFPSELVAGGSASWADMAAKEGSVAISPAVDWSTLVQSLNEMAVLEHQGWAVGRLRVTKASRVRLACTGVAAFYLRRAPVNGIASGLEPFAGDIYGSGWVDATVHVPAGMHHLFVLARAKMNGGFACTAVEVPSSADASLQARAVLVAPDIVAGVLWGRWLSAVVANPGKEAVADLTCEIAGLAGVSCRVALPEGVPLRGGHMLLLPLELVSAEGAAPLKCKGESLAVQVVVGGSAPLHHTLRCRNLSSSTTFTYLDHDGSVAEASTVAPLPRVGTSPAPSSYPLLLSFHGTGVSAGGQADAHKVMHAGDKDYTFGVSGYWVLAPGRFGAHNWQGVGAWSGQAAVRAFAAFLAGRKGAGAGAASCTSPRQSLACLPGADVRRILVSGHSMGGAGAWFGSTAQADRSIAAAPSAGWLVKESYSDANAFLRMDASEPGAHPRLAAVLESAVRDQRADVYASNLVGVPTHVRVGAEDRTVPPYFSRRMVRLLRAAGAGAAPEAGNPWPALEETRQKGHFWWDTDSPNDGGSLADPTMRAFYEAHVERRSSAAVVAAWEGGEDGAAGGRHTLPPTFSFTVSNTRTFWAGRAGLAVLQLATGQTEGRVQVDVVESGGQRVWRVTTAGVWRLRVRLGGGSRAGGAWTGSCEGQVVAAAEVASAAPIGLCVDGSAVHVAALPSPLHVCARDGGSRASWAVCFPSPAAAAVATDGSSSGGEGGGGEWAFQRTQRGPHNTGPARAVAASAFLIVVGTGGSAASTAAYARAGEVLSTLHALAFHTTAPVVTDVELTAPAAGEGCDAARGGDPGRVRLPCGHNLLLLGGPAHNVWTARLAAQPSFPLTFTHPLNASGGEGWGGEAFALGERRFDGPGQGVLATAGWWDARSEGARAGAGGEDEDDILGTPTPARLALVLAATDAGGLASLLRLAVPTIPPMVRAPFSNLVPDFLVTGAEAEAQGYGGLLGAGYWRAADWGVEEASSFFKP